MKYSFQRRQKTKLKTSGLFLAGMIILVGCVSTVGAQSVYETQIRPTVWYNTEDGVQLGVRFFGYQDNEEMGAYRLYTGFWLNTFIPELPVAYDIRFEHPLSALSSPQQAFTIKLNSSVREGFQRHGAGLSKRIKTGSHDDQFILFQSDVHYYQRFNDVYLVFPGNWQQDGRVVGDLSLNYRTILANGYQTLRAQTYLNTGENSHRVSLTSTLYQPLNSVFSIGLALGSRFDIGEESSPEFGTNLTFAPAYQWQRNGFFRSHGPLPVQGLRNGVFGISETGPALRGYGKHDVSRFQNGLQNNIQALHSASLELDIRNPIDNYISSVPIGGYFAHFKTRLFSDAAIISYRDNMTASTNNVVVNAGAGVLFYINIPNYLAEMRGFAIRWDVPFWVSDPIDSENTFKFRQQLSFDLIIPF